MAKITAIIDIGSNSARMAVFERTSQFGFHLVKEIKSRVRISENCYGDGGCRLQPAPMERACKALKEFSLIARALKARKILCVATSAVREAPNRNELINRVRREVGINIKVIDGETEAFYGAVAAMNLLPLDEAVTVDIGGGSTECALSRGGRIVEKVSLRLGTIRLKELFYDRKRPIDEAVAYVEEEFAKLPESLQARTVVGIGGTVRAMSKAIMRFESYPIDTLHGYEVDVDSHRDFYQGLYASPVMKLKSFGIKDDRLDTIREGALIFSRLLERFGAERIVTSGAGVREGVFLGDLLRNHHHVFPDGFNPSVRSLLDRYSVHGDTPEHLVRSALEIFDALSSKHGLNPAYKFHLKTAAKLSHIGAALDYYGHDKHGGYFITHGLRYGFTHKDRLLIALLVKYHGRKAPNGGAITGLETLYPDLAVLRWLSFILGAAECVNVDMTGPKATYTFSNDTLYIETENELYLAKEAVKKLDKPAAIALIFKYRRAV